MQDKDGKLHQPDHVYKHSPALQTGSFTVVKKFYDFIEEHTPHKNAKISSCTRASTQVWAGVQTEF